MQVEEVGGGRSEQRGEGRRGGGEQGLGLRVTDVSASFVLVDEGPDAGDDGLAKEAAGAGADAELGADDLGVEVGHESFDQDVLVLVHELVALRLDEAHSADLLVQLLDSLPP
eukprot:760062-Hanusia_phi.AAC.1